MKPILRILAVACTTSALMHLGCAAAPLPGAQSFPTVQNSPNSQKSPGGRLVLTQKLHTPEDMVLGWEMVDTSTKRRYFINGSGGVIELSDAPAII